mgnify:CR=1 FL=1|jgi:hypothetical protein
MSSLKTGYVILEDCVKQSALEINSPNTDFGHYEDICQIILGPYTKAEINYDGGYINKDNNGAHDLAIRLGGLRKITKVHVSDSKPASMLGTRKRSIERFNEGFSTSAVISWIVLIIIILIIVYLIYKNMKGKERTSFPYLRQLDQI